MKNPLKMAIVGGLAALLLPVAAQAGWHGGFGFSVGIRPGYCAPYAYCGPSYYGPAYYAPAYYSPPVVYSAPVYSAPVYTAPVAAPDVVYSAPAVVYAAPPVVYGPSIVVGPSFGFYGGHYRSYAHFGYHRR